MPSRRSRRVVAGSAIALLAGTGGMIAISTATSARQPQSVPAIPTAEPVAPACLTASAGRPLLAVVGGSFSAGVGAAPGGAWPQQLAGLLGWRLEVSADPGAGYTNPGAGDRGPMMRLARRLDLSHIAPALVLIQSGHNDIGAPTAELRAAVAALVRYVRVHAPDAQIGIVSVFATGNRPGPRAWMTDRAIVNAARHADPGVLIFDPLASHWIFPRISDHLHPSPAGHKWIAEEVASQLRGRYKLAGAQCPPDAVLSRGAPPR